MSRIREVAKLLTTDAAVFWRAVLGPVVAVALTSGVAREWPPSGPTVRVAAALLEVTAIAVLVLGIEHALRVYGKATMMGRLWNWWGRLLGCVQPRRLSLRTEMAGTSVDGARAGLGGTLGDFEGTEAKLRFLERKIAFLEADFAVLEKRQHDDVADLRRELAKEIAEVRTLIDEAQAQGAEATLGDFTWQWAALAWLASAALLPVIPWATVPSLPTQALVLGAVAVCLAIAWWVGNLPVPLIEEHDR